MKHNNRLNIELLLTGNELLSGDVIDSNSALISQALLTLGLETSRKITVKDDVALLTDDIIAQTQRADILIINGGLGPTVDDMTAQALADAAQTPLTEHPDAMAHLITWCQRRNYQLNTPNKKQAILPQGCEIIANEIGSAVGFTMKVGHCQVYATPGVPKELQHMMEQHILMDIQGRFTIDNTTDISRFYVFGLGESTIEELISTQLPQWPDDIELGYRATMPVLEVKLTSHQQLAHEKKLMWQQKLQELLGAHIIDANNPSMAKSLIGVLSQQHKYITVAESCTGGLISSMLTSESGSSQVFEAGFVTYSNTMKSQMVNVPPVLLQEYGAVSEPVVTAMLLGALKQSGADVGIAVSGIAGPNGGTKDKPVGLVWLAWGSAEHHYSAALYLPLTRHHFQQYVASAGLDLVKRYLLNITQVPHYLVARKA